MDSQSTTFMGQVVLGAGFIMGIVYGAMVTEGFWLQAIYLWAATLVIAVILFAIAAALRYLEEILHHVQHIRYPQDAPSKTKLGNSKLNLAALKDFKLESKE